MSDRKRSSHSSKRRRKSARRRQQAAVMRLAAVAGVLFVAAVGILLFAPRRSHDVIDNNTLRLEANVATQTASDAGREMEILAPASDQAAQTAERQEAPTEAPTAVPTEAPTEAPTAEPTEAPVEAQSVITAADLFLDASGNVSSVGAGMLPVFKNADILDRKIAITVDDCFQVGNLQTIAKTAYNVHGKLTLFPIGENLSKKGMPETIKTCVNKLGFEIENHTWSHQRIFRLPEQMMATEIWRQGQEVNRILGVNYEQHFFRLMGGDGDNDQRTHNYLKQLGFKGIAYWSISGSDTELDVLKNSLKPGQIYLFHTTDRDTGILKEFIPYAAQQGYQLVTMNELLGFEDNAITPYSVGTMPEIQHVEEEYVTHQTGDYAWNIVLMQDKLRALGILKMDGASTGYYGEKTADAVRTFQSLNGLPATGVADADTQKKLLDT